jgi:cyanophycinase-like exopeptidase
MTTTPAPGSVYLAASSHEGTLRAMASRILARAPSGRPLRVAATCAAAGGGMAEHRGHYFGRLFGGADVQRFTVDGESRGTGAALMPPAEAIAILERADVVFVSGGDPVQGARLLAGAGADRWLRDARARGTPCLGISAGAILLAAWWAEWPDLPPHGTPHDGGELVPCTGVVPDLVVDCHAEDDDWSELRLVRAMLRDRTTRGGPPPRLRFLGLPTGGGVVVGPDGTIADVGDASVPLG